MLVLELPTDQWIRCHVHDGDLLVLPAGIYHRFTLDKNESVKMMRLFKVSITCEQSKQSTNSSFQDEPKWAAHYRNAETDANPRRQEYLQAFGSPSVVTVA